MFIRIDGKSCACEPGELVVDIARRNDIDIPTLCHHEGLPGQGSCRVCIVEMNGRIVPACVTKVEKECEIHTCSPRIAGARGVILSMLKKRAPNSPEIAALCQKYEAPELPRLLPVADGDRCILCGLCVRACRSLGTGAISTVLRGVRKEVSTPYAEPSPSCIGCGSCASVCPTHSIIITDDGGKRKIWNKEFRLLRCVQCGAVVGTDAFIAHMGRSETDILCDACRQQKAAQLSSTELGY